MSVSENDKRWLVVLVATDKIVAPLLRDFVAKGIDKLKDFLNDHLQNISTGYTLETMTYLLCHPPPPASPDPYLKYLKFQNINNNEGLSKVNYNYSVNNVVDLAKLYLPGYLAKFAAFDNSMDMSAALRLLGHNDYPTQVFVSSNPFLDIKSLADDVRNTVRNPGAHYNESIWTDLFMNQCFEKLVALVKAFVLPADQEKDALDQLHRWKSNGWKLIIAKDLSDLMETLLQNRDVNLDSPETRRRLNILVTLLDRCDSVEERVSLTEERVSLTEERVSLTEEHLGLVKERQDELQRLVEEVIENLKENRVNQISGAHGQLEVPAVTTSSPFSRTSVVSADDLSEEASHMNKESGDETSESSSSSGVSENCIDSSGVNPPTSPFSRTSVVSADDLRGEASHMNEESGDEACEGSTSSGVSENCIDSFGEDLPENQPHVERINPDIVLLQRQNGAPFKIEFTGKLPEGMESGVADFENLRTGVEIVKMGVKTMVGAALPYSSRQGAFKVTVFSQNREKCLGETKVVYIDLIGAALEKAVTCPETMRKFIQAAIPCLNEHSEGDTCDAENLTNGGPSGREKSSLSVQLLQRFIYAAAKVNSVWFIRLIFELPAGRIAFDSYKGRPLLPEYVARARGHNEIAVYLRDVTKRYSESETTDEEKLRAINWQEIVTAIEATQENPNLSREGAFKVTVSSQNREKCLEETKVADIELIEETLKQAISYPNTMLKFIQAAIPRLNEHSEGGTSDAENHTNGGPSGWEKSLLSLQLLQKFIYAAAKVNAVWFIRLIFDLPAGRIAFDSYKGRPLLPEYVARTRGHNEIAEYLEDVTKRYSESERTDEEKFNAINWQQIVTAIEATQENPKNTESHRKRSDDLKSSVSPQQVRGKEPWSNFSDEQLNYFKFALIVKNPFHKALRQTFRTMWDNTFGSIIGFKPWDDSLEVRNLFLMAEGGGTRVPTHLSYEEWEFSTLLHATIYARSFSMPDSRGHHRTLSDLYVKPRGLRLDEFHTSVISPVGCDLESLALAIDQLRRLRNFLFNSFRAKIDKVTFDHLVQLAKEAFIALGIATAQIDAIALIAFDSPSLVLCEVEDGIKQDIGANVNFLEGFSSSLEESEEIIEALRQEHDQTTKNCNEVPPQMSLSVPKMSDIKVFRKKWSDVQFPIDILLLTMEEFEFLSSFAYLKNPFKSYDQDVGEVYFGNIGQLRVALVKSHGNTTPVDHAVSLEKAIIKMRPKVVFLVGICGSLNSVKARIGDVLITSKLGTYSQRGMRALESKLSSSHIRFFGEGWMAPLRDLDDREVRIHRGGLLLCVQDRKMSEELIQSHPDAFAIEVRDALATAITDIKVECIAVKGISHYGDASEESEGWKTFASVMAASVVANILEKGAVFEDWPHFQGTLPSPCLPPRDINFVGRERECEKIIVCSGFENTRLVSIWGPPGFGKTSVAIAVGHVLGSMGLPVYLFSLRDFQSKVDVTKMLLDFFKETAPIRQTPPCSSIDEQIIQHLSVISEQTVLVLDGADRLLGNIDFLNFLEDVLSRAEKLKLIITAVESFSLRHYHSHEVVRVGALDESSAKKLVSKLLPDATASDCTQLLQISKNIPLLLKIVSHSISEGNYSVNSFLDLLRAEERPLHRLLDSDVIGPTRDSLHGRLDEVFRKRPKKEREAFVSLSVFPNDFDVKVAAAVMGVTRIVEAKRILRHLHDSSLLESGSKPESFSMHSLARSFAEEIGETEFRGTLVTSDTRFREFYISHFMKLNEEFLTGDSMMAFVTFYEDEENIVQCLKLRPGSDSKTAEAVFKALVHAELFLHALYWTDEDRFVSIYDAAVKAAETLGEKEFHRELLVSSAFNEVTRDTRERGWQLLSEAKQLQKAALSTSDREKGKLMCYLGIYHLCNGEMEVGQHCLQESLPRIEGNLEETVLRLTISQILHMHDRFYTKSSSRAQCYKKILQEYTEAGNTDLLITSTLENTGKNSVEKVTDERDALKKRPLMAEVLFLVSKATESFTDIETKRRLSNIAVNILRENETTSPSTMLDLSRFHTNLRMLTNDEGEGLEKERQFREHASGKSYLQSRVINSNLSSKTSAQFTINTQHGTHCLPDALQAEQRKLAVRMSLLGPIDASTADSYYSLGVQQYASGDFTSSLESFMGALNIRRKCFGDTNSGTADCYHSVGVTQHALGDFISASQSLKSAVVVRLKLPGEHGQYTADSFHSLGATQLAMGDYVTALESFRHGLDIRLNTFGEMHVSTAESYHSLGNTARLLRDFASALQSYHYAFEIIRTIFGEEHPRTAEIYHSIGEVQSSLGDLTSARKSHQCALNIRLKVLGEEHHSTAESYQSIGDINVSLKDWKSALQFYQLALNIRVKAFGEKHLMTADSHRSIGETHFALNDLTSALQSFQCERNILLKVLGEEHPSIANSYHLIGDAHFALNDFTSALQSFQCALDIRLKVFGEEHCGTADSYHSLGETFYTLNDLTPAFQSFHHALSIRAKLFGEDHSETAESYHTLGVTEYAQGNYSSALNFSQKALDISHKLFRGDNQDTIEIYLTLGAIHYKLGNFDSAVQSFQSALVTGLKLIGKDHSRRADNYYSLGDTQHAKGDFNSAVESYKNALHIKLKLLGKSRK